MTEYTIAWTTTVVEHHALRLMFSELPEMLQEKIRTAGTLSHEDDEEILEFASNSEGYSTISTEQIESRIITGITKEDA